MRSSNPNTHAVWNRGATVAVALPVTATPTTLPVTGNAHCITVTGNGNVRDVARKVTASNVVTLYTTYLTGSTCNFLRAT